MNKTKKIVLFIVEGITDENSLSLILSKLIGSKIVHFHVINQDITSEFNSSSQNIVRKIDGEVRKYLDQNNGIKRTDIKQIIHLVDTDGTFIKDDFVLEDMNHEKAFYTMEYIKTNKRKNIICRNERKSSILNKLYQTNFIGKIPYKVYYFSCNLEHVLHNSQNTPCRQKSLYSYKFVDQYVGREKQFVDFISNNSFAVKGEYKDTWKFIKKDLNSLKRYCNFHLFFKN